MYILNYNIKMLRIKLGLTQEDLAERVGVSKATISNYENDITRPACSKLSKIADALGVKVRELFQGTVSYGFDETPQYTELLNSETPENENRISPIQTGKSPQEEFILDVVPHAFLYVDENGDVVIVLIETNECMIFEECDKQNIITEYDDRLCYVDIRSSEGEQVMCGDRAIGQILQSVNLHTDR